MVFALVVPRPPADARAGVQLVGDLAFDGNQEHRDGPASEIGEESGPATGRHASQADRQALVGCLPTDDEGGNTKSSGVVAGARLDGRAEPRRGGGLTSLERCRS